MTDCEPVDILVVEDNPGDARLTEEAFEKGRIRNTVHTVSDGVAALDFLYQRGDYPDAPRPAIIFLDLNLPRKNGDEVLEEVKDDPDLRDIPIIILTSSEAADDIAATYDQYANAYLTKPVDPFEFIEMIKQCEEFWFSIVRLPSCGD